ncbi:LrgB family protein [Falsirhodobacter halotolerans]|uniref:LrgB family protein n=1 Tax=Falsirhodobacter halotolerans TaxID=1146892 RepID=UPI001FD0DDAF|nr:LrgB family protein [Falsirhodobacter halotolerans]MCJ8140650.1 LrgB family protein [Falsirhodobacter halotolerans]
MTALWEALHHSTLIWLTATLAAFLLGDQLARVAGRHPLVNPVLVAVTILGALLLVTGTEYATYFTGTAPIHFLLGPATVALALPIRDNLHLVRKCLLPLGVALAAGSVAAAVAAVALAHLTGLSDPMLATLAPKSVTAPVAMPIAERLGGLPSLTAAMVILTGITGAIVMVPLMRLLRITDPRAAGFATGLAAHGIGTARALQLSGTAGAFAGLGMGLNAVLTGFVAPWALHLFR